MANPTTAVLDAAIAYQNEAIVQPVVGSKVAQLLYKPHLFQYSLFGAETKVRQVIGGNAVDYYPNEGYHASSSGGSVEWVGFTAPFDRMITDSIDSIYDFDSFLQGMKPSSELINEQSWARFAAEVDAVAIATIASSTPASNIIKDDTEGYEMTGDKFIGTLLNIRQRIFDGVGVSGGAGYEGNYYAFVDSETYAKFQMFMLGGFAVANSALIQPVAVDKDLAVNAEGLAVKLSFLVIDNNILLSVVPKSRMFTEIDLKSGRAGQEAGGWEPSEDATQVKLVFMPEPAAALSIRHMVAGVSLPMFLQGYASILKAPETMQNISKYYGGKVSFQNAGITQIADSIQFKSRIKYGVAHFDVYHQMTYIVVESDEEPPEEPPAGG